MPAVNKHLLPFSFEGLVGPLPPGWPLAYGEAMFLPGGAKARGRPGAGALGSSLCPAFVCPCDTCCEVELVFLNGLTHAPLENAFTLHLLYITTV